MTQEEKSLLLKDICARLPYKVICNWTFYNGTSRNEILKELSDVQIFFITKAKDVTVKPYLRPMSSMTEEEKREVCLLSYEGNIEHLYGVFYRCQDWLNSHYFDYRGLIEKGLAIEAPKGMYNLEEK